MLWRIQIIRLGIGLKKLLAGIHGHFHVAGLVCQLHRKSISLKLLGSLFLFTLALRFGLIFVLLFAFESV